jgi:hypothetical protein
MNVRVLFAGLCLVGAAVTAEAQTTVTLNTPAHVKDVAIRGGSYAATNFEGDLLVTRASSNPTYVRRALFDFDTETTIPAGATIQSAIVTVTVHWGGAAATRQVGVFPLTRAFTASEATWDIAANNMSWTTAGGDFGARATTGNVPDSASAQTSFNVTSLVQSAVRSSGSRRSHLALVDVDSLTNARAGYRDYYSVEAADPAVRPKLVVTYAATPSGTTGGLPNFSHVFVIVFENHEYGEVIGNPSAPYFNALAHSYGLGAGYDGVTHPSLPNYMALTGGNTVFTNDCQGCTTTASSIVDQVEQSGRTWRAYMETMPEPCTTSDSGDYAQKHNPFVHYTRILNDTRRCQTNVIPKTPLLGHLQRGDIANYTWITPNLCNDMHSCSVATGDTWLKKYVPAILASPAWDANSVIFVVFDEGTSDVGGGGRVPLIVVSPWTRPGTIVATPYNHYNLLATIEQAWGLPRLGQASGAAVMNELFNK